MSPTRANPSIPRKCSDMCSTSRCSSRPEPSTNTANTNIRSARPGGRAAERPKPAGLHRRAHPLPVEVDAHQLSHHGSVPRSPPAGLHDPGRPRADSHRLEPILGLGGGKHDLHIVCQNHLFQLGQILISLISYLSSICSTVGYPGYHELGATRFVIMHVLDSPGEMLPTHSCDLDSIIPATLGGRGAGLVSVTEYSPSANITVVPAAEPWNELGDGLFPSTWIV